MSANNTTSVTLFTGGLGYSLPGRIAVATVLLVIVIGTVCGNVVVMLAVARLRSMRTLSNAFVFSLAVADTLVAVGVMPWAVLLQWNNGAWTLGKPFCLLWLSWDIYFSTVSIVHFSCLAFDRYLAICDPFRYPRVVTRPTVGAMLLTCWVLPGFISFLPLFCGWHTYGIEEHYLTEPMEQTCFLIVNIPFALICSVLAFYAPLAAIVFCYWRIFVVAQRHAKKIRGLEVAPPERSRISKMQRDTKAAKTLAIVVGAFSACYIPFFTINVLDPFFDYSLDPTPGNKVWLAITWLGYCNSMLNPWIYYISNKNFRAAFRKILHCNNNNSTSRSEEDNDGTEVTTALHRPRLNGHLTTLPSSAAGVGTAV